MEPILVSVVMITYNHEKFIKQAIDNILIQQCSFNFELIIANDNSPDKTDSILQEYLNYHPKASTIRYFKHKENIGMMPNFMFALQKAKGKYIAICEGDDYWTDSLKLQKQVDFMESNSNYSIVFHQVQLLENTTLKEIYPNEDKITPTTTILDLSKNNYIPTVSVFFRASPKKYPDYMLNSPIGDYPLHLYNAEKGKIYFMAEIMAVYRIGVGVWSTQNNLNRKINTIKALSIIQEYYKLGNNTVFKNISKQKDAYFYLYLKEKEQNKGIINFIKILFNDPILKESKPLAKIIFILKYFLKK